MKTFCYGNMSRYILLLILCVPFFSIQAKEIQLQLPNQLTATAEYYPNNPDRPVVLVLHGFLQSNEFSTVRYIVDELLNNDYSVLAPTLSLNINRRKQSLNCDSLHTHNLNSDNVEINQWIEWLKKQGYQSIVLVGHSSGNMQLINYLQNKTEPVIKSLIAVSPVTVWNNYKIEQTRNEIEQAKKAVKSSLNKNQKYTIGFCDRSYITTPENFLSYAIWSDTYLLDRIVKLPIKKQVIIGDNDSYAPTNWLNRLRNNNIKVTVLEGADHFFSGDAEFLLQDSLIESLQDNL